MIFKIFFEDLKRNLYLLKKSCLDLQRSFKIFKEILDYKIFKDLQRKSFLLNIVVKNLYYNSTIRQCFSISNLLAVVSLTKYKHSDIQRTRA